MRWPLLLLLAACSDPPASTPDASTDGGGDLVSLDPTPTTYLETCDGSAAVALSFTHFLDLNDENQVGRIYQRAMPTAPVQMIELNPALGLTGAAEADLEDVERLDDRLFMISSHGRKTSGALDRARFKFAAFDIGGAAPDFTLTSAGTAFQILDQMLVAANWDTPNTAVIAALTTSSKLNDNNEAPLAPEAAGTNIEALASNGSSTLLIGFRNPRPGNKAIVVSLLNPLEALADTAHFGAAAELDLGGLGIRSMTYSPTHQAVLLIAGPHNGANGPFELYKWTGVFTDAPTLVTTITPPPGTAPEAVVVYPNTKDVQIVFDGGDVDIGGDPCKEAPVADRVFHDAIVTVD